MEKVAVIGAGIMGSGIAQVVSTAGFKTGLVDVNDELLKKAAGEMENSLNRLVSKQKITQKEKEDILSRITFSSDLTQVVSDADLIIEAVFEDLDLKKEMFGKIDKLSSANAILASNTSQFSITEIASAVTDPTRVIGMHWFNPPVMMKLIEVVKGLDTTEEVVEKIKDFAAKVGKEVVVCKDSQGFISTRVLMALRLECYRLYEEGVASKEDIDKTLKLALGHPMGQFELADFSGLNLDIPVSEALTKVFGDRFRPPQCILHLVKAGRLGRKTGRGWYDYSSD